MRDKYSVIVVTYNRLMLLKECISCILNQSYEVSQIIIINNASTDGTTEYLKTLKDNRFLIVNEESNLGGAGGFYEGLKVASTTDNDWVLIIDDDAMISSEYIERIDNFHRNNKDVLAFSGTVKTDNIIITDHRRRIIKKYAKGEIPVPLSEYDGEFFSYDLSTFCGLIIKKEVISKIGLPRRDFFIQYDDTEYCMRIRKLTPIINVNLAILTHKTTMLTENGDHNSRWNWKIYYGTRNKVYSCFNHGFKLVILNYIFRIICGSIKDFLNPRISKKVSIYNMNMIFHAVFCGLVGKLGCNQKYLP